MMELEDKSQLGTRESTERDDGIWREGSMDCGCCVELANIVDLYGFATM
jgi:hypothetical protein